MEGCKAAISIHDAQLGAELRGSRGQSYESSCFSRGRTVGWLALQCHPDVAEMGAAQATQNVLLFLCCLTASTAARGAAGTAAPVVTQGGRSELGGGGSRSAMAAPHPARPERGLPGSAAGTEPRRFLPEHRSERHRPPPPRSASVPPCAARGRHSALLCGCAAAARAAGPFPGALPPPSARSRAGRGAWPDSARARRGGSRSRRRSRPRRSPRRRAEPPP